MKRFVVFLLGIFIIFTTEAQTSRYIELADSADFYINHERWEKAESAIIEALRLEPANFSNALLLSNLGLVQTQKGEYDKALESFSLGLSISPSSTVILNNRAKTYLLAGKVPEASHDFDKSLQIDSIQEDVLKYRGYLYLQENDTQNASKLFSLLRDRFPDNPASYAGLAVIAGNGGNYDEAIDQYRKALSIDDSDSETVFSYLLLLIEHGKYQEARSEITRYTLKTPNEPLYYLIRGYLHFKNFRNDEAQADRKIAIDKGLDPQYVDIFIPAIRR